MIRLLTYPGALLLAFLLSGCGEREQVQPVDAEGHAVLRPAPGEVFAFALDNRANLHSSPTAGDEATAKDRLPMVPPSIWGSTCSGRLELAWRGYRKESTMGRPLACFSYTLHDLSFQEHSADAAHAWREEYAPGRVLVEVDGVPMANPLREKFGDPVDQFMDPGSQAVFQADGRPVRMPADFRNCRTCWMPWPAREGDSCPSCGTREKPGQVRPRGSFLGFAQFRTDSYSIGQYFLKGIPVDEMAHRSLVMTPPETIRKTSGQVLRWQSPLDSLVLPEDNAPPSMVRHETAGLTEYQGRTAWRVVFSGEQLLTRGRGMKTGDKVQGWEYRFSGEALLDPGTLVPFRVEITDRASWTEVLSLTRRGEPPRTQAIRRSLENRFEVRRLLGKTGPSSGF